MEEIGNAITLLAIFGFVAFLIWHGDKNRQARRELKVAEREKLLDRLGTGEALQNFLQSEDGSKFLGELNEPVRERRGGGNLKMSVIGLLTAGVITLSIGAGFFYAAPRVNDMLIVPGGIIGGIGVGCLIAALIHYWLGKSWGLLGTDAENGSSKRRLE
jgi:hypothetical protein